MKSRSISLTEGPLFSGIIRYTIPIILSSLLQLLFNAADLVVVGQFCGSISVGAVSSTGAITNLIVNLFVGLSVGAGVCVAHGLGGHQDDAVRRTVHTAIPLAILSGLILTVIGVFLTRPLLRMMKTPENVLPLAATYMGIYFTGMVFVVLYNYCAAILRAAGDTKGPLMYLTVAGVINVILNLIFVIVFHMNVAGVALATIISQGISAVLSLMALMKRSDACRFSFREMRIDGRQLGRMIAIGLPAGVQGSLFSISNTIIQASVNSFGSDVFLAGNGAASNIEGFVYTSINAFSLTTVNYIGQNAGAKKFQRVKKIAWICLGLVTFTGLTLGLIVYAASPRLLAFYITDSPEAIEYGMMRMAFICLPYFLCGLMDATTGALRGLGSSFVPMVVTVLGICGLRIAWIFSIFQIPEYHTPQCLYFSYPLSWVVTFALEIVLFWVLYRKKKNACVMPEKT